ncbi:MAG: hypothetical protein ACFFEN_01345 [Candidatus Thorarchaeota archaeon]
MTEKEIYIGIVRDGKFHPLLPEPTISAPSRLTEISRVEVIPPEARQVDLTQYEGKAIAVQGILDNFTLYEASVTDVAGPILTALVLKAFGNPPEFKI